MVGDPSYGGLRGGTGLRGIGHRKTMGVVDRRREGSSMVHHSTSLTRHGAGCSAMDGSRGCIHCSIVKPDFAGMAAEEEKRREKRISALFEVFLFLVADETHDRSVNGRRTEVCCKVCKSHLLSGSRG